MIEALYEIGYIQKPDDFEFIENIGVPYKHVFKVKFNIDDPDSVSYCNIDYEEYDKNKKSRYFYKANKGNGVNYTPTAKITDIETTFRVKVLKSVRVFLDKNKDNFSEKDKILLNKINDAIQNNKDKILGDLISFVKDMDLSVVKKSGTEMAVRDGGVITLTFMKDNIELYVGDLDAFKQTLLKNAYCGYYSKYNVESKSDEKQCYLCHKTTTVLGFVDTYKFYTVHKKGMVTGGFEQKKAWKNYPVCLDCAIVLERGREYIKKYLNFDKFCGFTYLIIPQLVYPDEDILQQLLKRMNNYADFSLKQTNSARIETTEERILKELSREGNIVNFNFIFYKVVNSAFNILLRIEEIAPTRLNYLIEAKYNIDKRKVDIFKEIPTKNGAIKFDFSFKFIRNFFGNSKIEGNYDKDFLLILSNIFTGREISLEFLLNRMMSKIRKDFLNGEEFSFNVDALKAYKIILYIKEIKLLKGGMFKMNTKNGQYEEFFSENGIFDHDTKKALFLEGVLAGKLLNIQFSDKQAKPFQSRLNGLKIDERVAKRLLPEIINKLEEYKKNYYRKMEESIGLYFINSDFAKFSINELSFYFTLGLTLTGQFNKEEKENEEVGNE